MLKILSKCLLLGMLFLKMFQSNEREPRAPAFYEHRIQTNEHKCETIKNVFIRLLVINAHSHIKCIYENNVGNNGTVTRLSCRIAPHLMSIYCMQLLEMPSDNPSKCGRISIGGLFSCVLRAHRIPSQMSHNMSS